jgi:hypothetical protein
VISQKEEKTNKKEKSNTKDKGTESDKRRRARATTIMTKIKRARTMMMTEKVRERNF